MKTLGKWRRLIRMEGGMMNDRWSDENRLIYIAKIADELVSNQLTILVSPKIKAGLERIFWLAEGKNDFLEANKDNYKDILE